MTTCRACAETVGGESDADELIPIFSKMQDEFIANLIVECSGVEIVEDDGLPSQICRPCLSSLQQTTIFIQVVRSADRKLRKGLEGEFGKEENKDSDNDTSQNRLPWQTVPIQLDGIKNEDVEDQGTKSELDIDWATGRSSSPIVLDEQTEERNDDHSDKEVNSESEMTRKQTRRKRRSKIVEDATDSDSDDRLRKKRKRQTRPRTLEYDIGKGDESEGESIPEARLRELYKTVQVDANTFVCCACLKIFTNRSELIEHGQSSHTKKKYINESKTNICDVCFRRYSKPGPLEAHKQSFVGLDVVYECFRCLTRVIAQNRHQHARTHLKHMEPARDDDKSKREQRCCAKDCTVTCSSEELLITHGKGTHIGNKVDTDDPQRRFECPVCYKRFEKREALTRHRHRMYRATHQCAVCGKEFKNRYEMLVHERNHENRKPYSCEICGKRFNSKEAVRVHMLVHSDSKPFSCTVCGWRFRRKCNLNKHASKHREDTPFECSVCQKTFKGKYHLQYHLRTHTGHKPWKCRYCDKSFADHANRARHETSHTGIKPYKCSFCDKTFIRRRFQIEHESTHTGIKPYRCEMCNRTFSQKTSLKKHLEMHPLAPENQISLAQPSPMPVDSPMSPPPPAPSLMPPPSTAVSSTMMHQQQQQQQHPNAVAMMAAAVAAAASMAPIAGQSYQQI
ncbi:zinc finger protein 271-like isoform X1 [Ochlerotatus camptorhynchus]|uniref:zinc finger protein 271-like isoform X1 n=1 Tax=Ochlerotatus camptorhynchus TaxID=644619 RepID=UPI0031D7CCE7